MLRIILRRFGKRKLPFFQIVVCSHTKKNRWLFKDRVGFIKKAGTIRFMGLDVQRLSYWLLRGADYCTSLVKYFAFYTRMHKFEWRTYSKNFKRTDKKLLQEDLVNNLLWKWLSYKTRGSLKDNFKHLKALDAEQDFDVSVSDFTTYITWRYNKMRKYSGIFSEDVNRYKLRLNNRKYYLHYVHAFSKFLNKQKRNLFRFNVLNKFKTIDALKQDVIVGKLRRRFQKFSYRKFLKTYKHLPSFTDSDLWSFDSVKPVERYITLMSTYIQKYTPLKNHIFSLNFRFNFFSLKNINLLYIWKKNWQIFNLAYSRMLGVTLAPSIRTYNIFFNSFLRRHQNSVKPCLNTERINSRFLAENKDSFLNLKHCNYNIFQRGLNDILSLNIKLKEQRFKKFVSAFNEEIGGPYFFKKSQLYNKLALNYSRDSEKFLDLKKRYFLSQPKIKPTNRKLNFLRENIKEPFNINFAVGLKNKFSSSNFSLNFENQIKRFNTFKSFRAKSAHLDRSYAKDNDFLFRFDHKKELKFKNLKFFKQYTFYKKYKYENIHILNKYVILLKYATSRIVQETLDANIVGKYNILINYKNSILNLIKNSYIINWLLFLKNAKFALFLINLRSDFFINYFFKQSIQLKRSAHTKYYFWNTVFSKKYSNIFLTKSDFQFTSSFHDNPLFANIRRTLFNKFLSKFRTFLSHQLQSEHKFPLYINKNVILNLVNYLKYKFSILALLFSKYELNFENFFNNNLKIFDIILSILAGVDTFRNDIVFQLYQVFLNIQVILFDLESVLIKITGYNQTQNVAKKLSFNYGKSFTKSDALYTAVQKKKEIDLISVIYLRNFFYFNNDSITNVSVNNLFTKSVKLKSLFKNKVLHQLFLTNRFSTLFKRNKSLISNAEAVFNKLVFKFDFEYLWQKIYNLFLKSKFNFKDLSIVARKKLLRSRFKTFFFTNLSKSNFIFFKKKNKFWQIQSIFSKFKGFIFLKENLVVYLRAIMKYNYFWTYLLLHFKKSFFISSVNQNLRIYLFFLARTLLQWEGLRENLENTKFVFNYDVLLKQFKHTLSGGLHDNISYEQQSLYSKFSRGGSLIFEKSLDMYIWNLLLKNNNLFFQHKQKFLTVAGFFKFAYGFKQKFKTLHKKLGYFPFLGKYFKMYFLSILQLLRYLDSNNYLRTFLFLKLHRIRKQFKIMGSGKMDKGHYTNFKLNLKWKTPLFKYQNLSI